MSEVNSPVRLTRTAARRIAVRAQLLAAPRPTELLDVIKHLTLMQADQTAAVAPNAELVGWSRIGSVFGRHELDEAMTDGSLIELDGLLRPAEHIAHFRAEMELWRESEDLPEWQEAQRDWVEANDGCRRDILEKLADEGPLPSRVLPDTSVVPWQSSGWNNDRNVRMMLELMVQRGEVAAAGRDGRERLWDLAERIYPDGPTTPIEEAQRILAERRLHALGIARSRATKVPGEPNDVGEVGESAVIAGVRGLWRVDPIYLDGAFHGRAAIISPLDRLVFDRKRMEELFEFDYQLEMYKPAAKRRWGYWAMPILYGDRLVGKLDATADRDRGVLRVDAIHQDVPFSKIISTKINTEIESLAGWLELDLDLPA